MAPYGCLTDEWSALDHLQVFSISPDGRRLAFLRTGKDRGFEIWTLPLDLNGPEHPKSGKPESFANESFSQVAPAFSPDRRWIAYVSTNGAGLGGQITVRPFPSASSSGRWQISESESALNRHPVWTPDGQHMIYGSDVSTSDGEFNIRWIRGDGSSKPEKLFGERTGWTAPERCSPL